MRLVAFSIAGLLAGCTIAYPEPMPMAPPVQAIGAIPPQPFPGGPAEQATAAALARIATLNPALHAVIATDPTAMDQARRVDSSGLTGPLAGQPVLIKDNIEAIGPMPTTAGSLALANNVTNRDAPLVARLRQAGAIVLGKTNLSEWANIRSTASISGWSAVGGQTRNPWALDRNPCGSSSGSGSAVAAGMVQFAIGTETDGSVTCPASINGIVGLKPTVGLVSRTFIVPISHSQDTAGPMTDSVRHAAELLRHRRKRSGRPCHRGGGQAQDRLCSTAGCRLAQGQTHRCAALCVECAAEPDFRGRAIGAAQARRRPR